MLEGGEGTGPEGRVGLEVRGGVRPPEVFSGTVADGVGLLEDTWVIVGATAVQMHVSPASTSSSYCACMREPPIGSNGIERLRVGESRGTLTRRGGASR